MRFASLLLALLLASPLHAAVTFVQNQSNSVDASGPSVTVTVTSTTAGSLLVAFVKFEGTPENFTVTEGAGAFTNATAQNHTNGDLTGRFAYKLVAEGGDTSIVVNWDTDRPFKYVNVWEFTYTDTASLDTQIATGQGSSSTPSTGNFTPSANSGLAMAGVAIYDVLTLTAGTVDINGVDATNIEPAVGTGYAAYSWSRENVGTFTGAGTATMSASRDWAANGISFNFIGGAAPTCRRNLALLGAGC